MMTNDSKDQGREAFEAWMAENRPDAELYRRDVEGSTRYGEYCKRAVQDDWILWQAALATSASALARDEASVALMSDDEIARFFHAVYGTRGFPITVYGARELVHGLQNWLGRSASPAASSAATVSDEASVQADAPVGWQFRDRVEGEWTKWRHANTAIRERYKDCPNTQFRPVFLATSQAATTAVAQDERAAFEAWMKNRFPHSDTTGFASVMWLAWQARAVSSAPPLTSDSDGWQPIETAPRGAKGYCWMNLAWGPEGDLSTGVGMRWGDRFFAAASFYCLGREKKYEFREVEVRPSYWMPLLSAPAQSTNGEQS
jgi:hypothetical protein